MKEETNKRIESLESEVATLTAKVNEVVACLEENKISRQVGVEYLYKEGEEEETPVEEEAETPVEEEAETPVD